jgi:hypothetical protein
MPMRRMDELNGPNLQFSTLCALFYQGHSFPNPSGQKLRYTLFILEIAYLALIRCQSQNSLVSLQNINFSIHLVRHVGSVTIQTFSNSTIGTRKGNSLVTISKIPICAFGTPNFTGLFPKENGQIGPETVILDDYESKANSKAKDSKAHPESDDSDGESDNPLDVTTCTPSISS